MEFALFRGTPKNTMVLWAKYKNNHNTYFNVDIWDLRNFKKLLFWELFIFTFPALTVSGAFVKLFRTSFFSSPDFEPWVIKVTRSMCDEYLQHETNVLLPFMRSHHKSYFSSPPLKTPVIFPKDKIKSQHLFFSLNTLFTQKYNTKWL